MIVELVTNFLQKVHKGTAAGSTSGTFHTEDLSSNPNLAANVQLHVFSSSQGNRHLVCSKTVILEQQSVIPSSVAAALLNVENCTFLQKEAANFDAIFLSWIHTIATISVCMCYNV